MAVETFAAPATRPDVVFCDTSFLLDLLSYEIYTVSAALVGVDAVKQARVATVAAFFNRYRQAGTQFVSSPFAFQEAAHRLTKAYPKARGHASWTAFLKNDPQRHATAHGKAVRLHWLAHNRIRNASIWLTLPEIGEETDFGRRSDVLIEVAHRLMKKYQENLDWADAYHIAMGAACGVEWFATTDEGWKHVAEINVFCYK